MLTYNTQLPDIKLPEYGRNIQNMVEHCLTIDDREERTRAAYAIVKAMTRLFPTLRSDEGGDRKFWDHLNIMSGFKLDIDWPVDVIQADSIEPRPEPLPYDITDVRRRQYGSRLEVMIQAAADMPEGEDRDMLVRMLANQMKKDLLAADADVVDERIYNDIYEMSEGRIRVDATTAPLWDYNVIVNGTSKKKKKK